MRLCTIHPVGSSDDARLSLRLTRLFLYEATGDMHGLILTLREAAGDSGAFFRDFGSTSSCTGADVSRLFIHL